jgi:hypothetical protein
MKESRLTVGIIKAVISTKVNVSIIGGPSGVELASSGYRLGGAVATVKSRIDGCAATVDGNLITCTDIDIVDIDASLIRVLGKRIRIQTTSKDWNNFQVLTMLVAKAVEARVARKRAWNCMVVEEYENFLNMLIFVIVKKILRRRRCAVKISRGRE